MLNNSLTNINTAIAVPLLSKGLLQVLPDILRVDPGHGTRLSLSQLFVTFCFTFQKKSIIKLYFV